MKQSLDEILEAKLLLKSLCSIDIHDIRSHEDWADANGERLANLLSRLSGSIELGFYRESEFKDSIEHVFLKLNTREALLETCHLPVLEDLIFSEKIRFKDFFIKLSHALQLEGTSFKLRILWEPETRLSKLLRNLRG